MLSSHAAHENKIPKISLHVPGFLQQAAGGPKSKPILHKMIEDMFLNPADGPENFRHPSLTTSLIKAMGSNRAQVSL